MAITNSEISSWINKAQQRIGSWGLYVAQQEPLGKDVDEYYRRLRYLSGAVDVLQTNIDDLSTKEKEKVVGCMITIGDLGPLANTIFSFSPITVLNLNGTYDGLTDTPLLKTGFDKQTIAVDEANNRHVYRKLGIGDKVLVVSNEGEDATAQKGNLLYHWRTLLAAKTSASSGDTILVLPGLYDIPDGVNLYKDGVTYNFMDGAVINSLSTSNLFDSTGGSGSFKILGNGLFNSNVTNPIISIHSGVTMTVRGRFYQNNDDIAFEVFEDATLTLEECTIVMSNVAKKAVGFNVADGNTNGAKIYVYDAWSNQNVMAPDPLLNFKINNIQLDPEVQ